MRGTHLTRILIILFLLVGAQNQFSGYSNPQKNQKPLQHGVTVTLKLIQVYVTDKDGDPVTDLEKEDFVLYDNRKLQTITDFEKHFTALKVKPATEAKPVVPSEMPSRMHRKFFLILDMQQNDPIGMIKAKRAALHFVDTRLHPEDEVGVLSFSPKRGIVLDQYLTKDREKVREAVKRARELTFLVDDGGMPLAGRAIIVEESTVQDDLPPAGGMLGTPVTTQAGGRKWFSVSPSAILGHLSNLAKALKYIPGTKHLLLFSGGGVLRLQKAFEAMGKKVGSTDCKLYTIDTMGTRDHVIPGFPKLDGETLEVLAEKSGGQHFADVDEYESIADQIQKISGNYYVLGYYIDQRWDGRYHEIKVEVKRKDCQVFVQSGYFNPKPFTSFTDLEKKLHLFDIAMSKNPYFEAPYPFPLTALPCPVKNRPGLILLSEIHVDSIEEVIGKETEIVTLIFDEENNIVDSSQGEADLTTVPQKLLHHYMISSLEPGDYECRVVLRNLETGRSALGVSAITIPEVQPSGIFIYPPFILIPDTPCFYLKALKTEKEKEPVQTVSLNDIYPFLANNHSPLVSELDGDIRKLLTVLKFCVKDVPNPELDISANLILQSTGEKIPLYFFLLDSWKAGTEDALLLELHLPELEPGQYEVEFFIKCYEPNMEASVKRKFRVR